MWKITQIKKYDHSELEVCADYTLIGVFNDADTDKFISALLRAGYTLDITSVKQRKLWFIGECSDGNDGMRSMTYTIEPDETGAIDRAIANIYELPKNLPAKAESALVIAETEARIRQGIESLEKRLEAMQ